MPPRTSSVTLAGAIADHKALFLIPPVVLLAVALAIGMARSPVYTASARLSVGGTDLARPSVLAAGGAAESLGAGFSRALTADPVLKRVSQEVGSPVSTIRDRLHGSPTPDTNLIVIEATGDTARDAINLANFASLSLIRYSNRLNDAEQRDVEARLEQAVRQLEAKKSIDSAASSAESRAAVEVAQLRRDSLAAAYRLKINSEQAVLRVFAPAGDATSDRISTLELLLFIGLALGLILGATLALWRAQADAAVAADFR